MRYYILFIFLLSSSLFSDETENLAVDSLQFHSYFLNSYFNQSNFLYPPVNHYAGLKLFNKSLLPEVRLYFTGNISVNGDLISEDNDLFTSNLNENKTWDLDVEQNQAFRFDVHLGERLKMSLKQDSEEDFSWEDNLKIVYQGKPGEFFQRAEAGGGINFSLPGRYFPILEASKKDSLTSYFGLKTIHQLGPISMYSILARSHTTKIEKHFEGGAQIDSVVIQDYNFIVDRYFFINDNFKNNFYPLNENNTHVYDQEYVIGEVELFQKVRNNKSAALVQADAYIDPNDLSSYSVGGIWEKLEEDTDYTIDRLLGYIRIKSAQDAIAVAYTTTFFDQFSQSFGNNQNATGTNFKSVYDECVESSTNYQEECGGLITLKLLKDINSSTPNSPTWPLMFKNVYSMGSSNIDPSTLEIEIIMDQGTDLLTTHSDNGNSYLSIFGLDSEDQNHEKVEGGDGKIDLYGSILNLTHGELILPAYLPFAYDESAELGNNHDDLNGILPELNEVNLSPAIYYDTNKDDINSQHKFVIKVKTSSVSSSMSLGLMVEEGSETVSVNNQHLVKDVDYY